MPTQPPSPKGPGSQNAAKHDTKVDQFYADQTPANAVALAIADAKADGNGTPEFFYYLNRAEEQLRDPVRSAAPDLLSALQASQTFIDSLKSCIPDWAERMAVNGEGYSAANHAAIRKATA